MILTELKKGEKATILNLSRTTKLVQRRLLDLGVTEGEEVCYKCALPFGGPCMLEVCGQCIGLRRNEAKEIQVVRT
ncbi:ferrous iron transport protein A [Terrilactibacillus sp. BCM23-1]|uniref:Ferrous iron transport protein A n=1 Tax=Terrilactibacillus tamarindi TaxID=2599694 RepID=A0A6N8CTK2_9BACI|nr:FeoA family protein [Terrilactibacillus tamarindi]MTT33080.1 ferrous iron transport protein A [Terrilactibacillus tamarindi]